MNQLSLIFDTMGRPPAQDLYRLPPKQQDYIRNFLPSGQKKPWDEVFKRKLQDMDREYIMKVLKWENPNISDDASRAIEQTATTLAPLVPRYDEGATFDLRMKYNDQYHTFRREIDKTQNRANPNITRWIEEADFFWKFSKYNETHDKEWDDYKNELKEFRSTYPLLDALLTFNPAKRPTAAAALAHPWLAGYHSPEDEPVPLEALPPTIFWFEKEKNGIEGHDFRGKTKLSIAKT